MGATERKIRNITYRIRLPLKDTCSFSKPKIGPMGKAPCSVLGLVSGCLRAGFGLGNYEWTLV
jgi:hypothetical protein